MKPTPTPDPTPLPPCPAELTADVIEHVNWLIRRTGRGTADDAIRALAWLVSATGEADPDTERTRSTLAEWGIACGPRDVNSTRIRAAIECAGSLDPGELYSEIRAELDDPLRQRLRAIHQLYTWTSVIGRHLLSPRYRERCLSAIAAITLILVVRNSTTLCFANRQLLDEIERSLHNGPLPTLAIVRGVGVLSVVQIVRESGKVRRIEGEKSDIIKKLDKFSLKQLQLLEAEYRALTAETLPPEGVAV